ncbi:hypothetical protein [Candidatus Magnetominusculus xianensis]|uniref:Uncharacterized protein n=1 Tax=Candidatus Magnetominusculus xianensis TaxID=1748249 RepID=A0ABR5SJG8_9BACT|nr:hypothetical protein [Candidatus Magnetominusculus xianensis]KWT94632.1 hypothetical protein ASN18_0171 [Candidatus Magnetominusculus xianensis]MBF0403344.1 hypothetical protein [Nitrospirota bacterium]
MAFALMRSNDFAERLNQSASIGDLRSLEFDILSYLESNPEDSVTPMIILIACYMNLNDIENAELIVNKCYKLVKRNVPFDLAMYKANIENAKGNNKEAFAIVRTLLKYQKLDERERVIALIYLMIVNTNLANFEEVYKYVLELWNIINHNSEIDFEEDSFYSKVSQYIDPRSLIGVVDKLKSYLKGKEQLKNNETYSEIYRYVKEYTNDNRLIEDIIPYEEVDIEFPDEKYFSLKLITKPMSVEESHNLEIQIARLIESNFPFILVLVDVIARK